MPRAMLCLLLVLCIPSSAVAHAGPLPQPGRQRAPNSALAFDGVDDYVEIPHEADVNFGHAGESFTIEAWVRLPTPMGPFIIAAKGHYAWGTGELPFRLDVNGQGQPGFVLGASAAGQYAEARSAGDISPATWHHVAGVRDAAAGVVRLFVDGALQAEAADAVQVDFTREEPIYIARNLTGEFGQGAVDELRLSNVARYTVDFRPPTASFVADAHTTRLWRFDDDAGDIAFDSTAAREGRVYGATWTPGYPFPDAPEGDREPPALVALTPEGTLPPLTGPVTVGAATDEAAQCRYTRRTDAPTSQMVPFDVTGGAQHTAAVYDLYDGNTYTLYVYCVDAAGNFTRAPGTIRFAVERAPDTTLVVFADVASRAETVGLYDRFEVSFRLNKAYPNPYRPYSAAFGPYGVTVDGLFSPDDWATTIVQPGFFYEGFERVGDGDWVSSLYPTGEAVWKVRFAPPALGAWQYRLRVTDASGEYLFPEDGALRFEVTPSDNPGFIHVSEADPRYFAFSNGATFFPFGFGAGYGRFDDLEREQAQIGVGGANFFRWWLSGMNIAGSSWVPWSIQDVGYSGYIPPHGLTAEASYGTGLFSVRLDATAEGLHCMSQTAPLKPDTAYVVSARVRLVGVGDPIDAAQPYGFMFREAGWAEPHRCLNPGEGAALSHDAVALSGDHDWTVVTERFESGDRASLSLKINLQNVRAGVVYVDSVSFREDLGNGDLGPEVLARPDFDYQDYFSQRPSWFLDRALEQAEAQGLYYKFVLFEKDDWVYTHIDHAGRPQAQGDPAYFHAPPEARVRRLQTDYLRYLTARWGYSTAIHSWEVVNEYAPGDVAHFTLVNDLARYVNEIDPNRHPVTTSTWCCGVGDEFDLWNDARFPDLGYGDFHAYTGPEHNTSWIAYTPAIFDDTADWLKAHTDAVRAGAYRFPFVAGEVGLTDAEGEADALAQDTAGVWLHNLSWAWLYDGRVSTLYWWGDNIRQHGLYEVWRPVRAFLDGIPLSSGFYEDAQAATDNPRLRAWGQKDVAHGGLHLWVQNTAHTWKNVVDGVEMPAESGTITVGGFTPGATLNVETWDTYTGEIVAAAPVVADAAGNLALTVEALTADLAFRALPHQ